MEIPLVIVTILVVIAVGMALYDWLGRSKWDEDEWDQMKARDQWMDWLQKRDADLPPPTWKSTAYPSSWTETEKRFAEGDR